MWSERAHLALLFALACAPALAAPDGGHVRPPTPPISIDLRGMMSPPEAFVRVESAAVTVRAGALRQQGIAVGVASYDEVICEVTVKNTLERAVRDVQVELLLMRETPTGSARPRGKGEVKEEDDEIEGERTVAPATAIPGWRFRMAIDEVPATASRSVSCRQALPPLEDQDRPTSLAELTFSGTVAGYRVPRLALARAVELVQRGTPADQRSAWKGYGEEVRGDARAFDEQMLLGLLGASPSLAGRLLHAMTDRERHGGKVPRTPLEFAFLLHAARRIGGQPTLEGLILWESRLVDRAPALPPRRDEAHPPENHDLLPASWRSAVHETIVDVAHHNIAGLYLVLHPNPPPPPRILIDAARQLADDEGLHDPDSWLEAAALLPPDVPQFNPDTDREGRLPIVPILAKYGGPEVLPALSRALDAAEPALREEAAVALAHRGEPGVARLLDAFDTDDDERRAPIGAALARLVGADLAALARVAQARGVPAAEGRPAVEVVAAVVTTQRAARANKTQDRLQRAETLAAQAQEPDSDRAIAELLAQAKAISPRAFVDARERVAGIAARVYRTRAAAGRADARAVLDDAGKLGPIDGREFHDALRDARIAEARSLAAADPEHGLERALLLLGDGRAEPPTDPVAGAAARALLLAHLDRALARREAARARWLLDRARRYGAPASELAPRAKHLRTLRLAPALSGGAAALVALALGAGIVIAVRRRRRRSRRARSVAPAD